MNFSLSIYSDFHNNSLNGPIPDFLGSLPNLELLDLSGNRLTGSTPTSLSNNENLTLEERKRENGEDHGGGSTLHHRLANSVRCGSSQVRRVGSSVQGRRFCPSVCQQGRPVSQPQVKPQHSTLLDLKVPCFLSSVQLLGLFISLLIVMYLSLFPPICLVTEKICMLYKFWFNSYKLDIVIWKLNFHWLCFFNYCFIFSAPQMLHVSLKNQEHKMNIASPPPPNITFIISFSNGPSLLPSRNCGIPLVLYLFEEWIFAFIISVRGMGLRIFSFGCFFIGFECSTEGSTF
ncbi:hypothetical protein DVH24_009182 [Malus domestica]|uniref:Uncharacterized protein n=1 Tax=Malus domestica TaxID=3750 RepID=A0A498JLS3_MALDO|nr:hypothetical protein DVH24_009182 [Malus domestica]